MTDVFDVLADLVIIIAGVVMTLAGWNWIANHTWRKWHEERLWREADKKAKRREARRQEHMVATRPPLPAPELLVLYKMEDGSHIDEYSFVTDLEWFDDRDSEIRLTKRTYVLVNEELVVLPDPYPIEEDE